MVTSIAAFYETIRGNQNAEAKILFRPHQEKLQSCEEKEKKEKKTRKKLKQNIC